MASITKDTLIGDILTLDETTAPFFLEMVCIAWAARLPAASPWKKHAWFTVWM